MFNVQLSSSLNFKLAFVRLSFVYICCLCCHYCLCTHTCITQCPFVIEAVLYPLYPHHHHRHNGCINIKCSYMTIAWEIPMYHLSCQNCSLLIKRKLRRGDDWKSQQVVFAESACADIAQELNNCTMWNKGLVLLKQQIVWQESNKRLPAEFYKIYQIKGPVKRVNQSRKF